MSKYNALQMQEIDKVFREQLIRLIKVYEKQTELKVVNITYYPSPVSSMPIINLTVE